GARHDLQPLEGAHHGARDGREGDDEAVGVARLGDQLVLGLDETERGHAGGDAIERGLAVAVVALAATLDDVDVRGPGGHGARVYTHVCVTITPVREGDTTCRCSCSAP